MITKFKTNSYPFGIIKVEATRETDSCVWVKHPYRPGEEVRKNKRAEYESYFDTFQQAKDYLLKKHQELLDRAKRNVENCQKNYDMVLSFKEPEI